MTKFISNIKHFSEQFLNAISNWYMWVLSILAYMIGFPERKQMLYLVVVFFVFDIGTRIFAIAKQNGGFWKSIVSGKLSSRKFIEGFISKSIFYFVILTMANVAEKADEINIISGIIATVFYCGIALYETISILENIRDAGFAFANGFLHKINKHKNDLLDITENDKIDDGIKIETKKQE